MKIPQICVDLYSSFHFFIIFIQKFSGICRWVFVDLIQKCSSFLKSCDFSVLKTNWDKTLSLRPVRVVNNKKSVVETAHYLLNRHALIRRISNIRVRIADKCLLLRSKLRHQQTQNSHISGTQRSIYQSIIIFLEFSQRFITVVELQILNPQKMSTLRGGRLPTTHVTQIMP